MFKDNQLAGIKAALWKHASLDNTVHMVVSNVISAHLPKGREPSPGDELEDLLPDDGQLESVIQVLEENFSTKIPDKTIFALMAEGTVAHLEKAFVKNIIELNKVANHSYYMQNRAQILQRNRQYRMKNLAQIRRRARIYRAKVSRRQIRPRKRIGTRGGGYRFVAR